MCTEAKVICNGEVIECENVRELATALGVPPHVVSNDPPDCCLCNAKWDDLGARRATDAEGWPFTEYIIERTNTKCETTGYDPNNHFPGVAKMVKLGEDVTDPPQFGTQDAQAASGDFTGMDARAGQRNATQAILGTKTGQTKKQTEGLSK